MCVWHLSIHLKRAIAKDLGEDRGREVGDDREQDRHPGCVQDEEVNVEGAMFEMHLTLIYPKQKKIAKSSRKVMSKEF